MYIQQQQWRNYKIFKQIACLIETMCLFGKPSIILYFQGSNETVSVSGPSVQVTSNTSDNCENHISIQYEFVAMEKGAVFSCVSTKNADQSELFKESSAPTEILEASKRLFIIHSLVS